MHPSEITAILTSAGETGEACVDELVPLLYDELRRMAHWQLSRQLRPKTLDTTGLVHEVYMKLARATGGAVPNRRYFLGAAARAMRQVLVDAARRRRRQKRGGGRRPIELDETSIVVDAFAAELIDLDRAVERLATVHPRQARVVECRFFGGLTVEETSEILDISPRTVKRHWALARAWLQRELDG
jgi:RNA polymerase sigma factor (TIGR02999 family)